MSTGQSFQTGGSATSLHSEEPASVLRHSGSQTLRTRSKRTRGLAGAQPEQEATPLLTASIHVRHKMHDKGLYTQYDVPEAMNDLLVTEGGSFGGEKPSRYKHSQSSESLKFSQSEALLLSQPQENAPLQGGQVHYTNSMTKMTSLAMLPPTSNTLVSSLISDKGSTITKSLKQIPSVAAALQLESVDRYQRGSQGSLLEETQHMIQHKQPSLQQTRITIGAENTGEYTENVNSTVGRHQVPVNQLQNAYSLNPLHIGDYDTMQHVNMKQRGNMEKMITKVKSQHDIRVQQEELVRSLAQNNKFVEHREQQLQNNNTLLMDNQNSLVTRLKAVEADFQKVTSDFQLIQKRYALNDAEVERQRKNLAQQYEESTAHANRLLHDINGLENQKQDQLAKMSGLGKECKVQKEKIDIQTVDYTGLQGRYDTLKGENADLNQSFDKALLELSEFRDLNHDQQVKITRTEISYEDLRVKMTGISQEKAMKEKQYQQIVKDLSEKNGSLHESLEKLETEHFNQGRQLSQKESEAERQVLVNTSLDGQVEELTVENGEQQQELTETKDALHTMKHLAAERSSTITLLELKLTGVTEELDESRGIADKLQKDIEFVYRPIEAKERKVSSQLRQLQTKFQSAMKTVVALNTEVGDLKDRQQDLMDELEREKRMTIALNASKQTQTTEVAWLKQTAKQQTTLLKQLQAQVQVMKQKRQW